MSFSSLKAATEEYLETYTGSNGNNDSWFNKLENKLLHSGCMGITADDYVAPPNDVNTAVAITRYEHDVRKKEKFMAIVREACGFELKESIIGDETDPKVIWQNIVRFKDSTRETNPLVIRMKLDGLRMGSSTAQMFVHTVMAIRRDILRCGGEITDTEVIAKLLGGIPHKNVTDDFYMLVSQLKQKRVADPENCSLADVVQSILMRDSEVQTLLTQNGQASNGQESAMISLANERNSKRTSSSRYGSTSTFKCWHCESTDHDRRHCPKFLEFLQYHLDRMQISKEDTQKSEPSSQARNNLLTVNDTVDDEEKFEDAKEELEEAGGLQSLDEPSPYHLDAEEAIESLLMQELNTRGISCDHPYQGW